MTSCISNEIKIGNWCVFQNVFEKNETEFLLGNILSFRYVSGKTNSEKKYSWDFASVGKNRFKENSNNEKALEILASWYEMDLKSTAPTFKHAQNTFIHMQYYVANLSNNLIEKQPNKMLNLSKKYSKSIVNLLPNFK